MSGGGGTAGGRGEVSSSGGWGEAHSTQGERIWSSLVRQKVERRLLLLIPILWVRPFRFFFFRYFASQSETQSVSLSFRYFSRKNKLKFRMFSHVFASNFSLQSEAKKYGKNFASFRFNFF